MIYNTTNKVKRINKDIKINKTIKLHGIIFNTEDKARIWKIYYYLKNKIEFRGFGQDRIKEVLKYISENLERLEKEWEELQLQAIDFEIKKPKNYSEFEVQATLYAILKFNHKIDVRGEVSYKMPRAGELKVGNSRFDLVVFKNDKAICIIEVKNGKKVWENLNTRQHKKYSRFGLKLVYCMNMSFVKQVAKEVLEFHNNFEATQQDLVSRLFDNV
jgi:hypothetical protein